MPMNIAIDGPVGAGKSSIADQVAQRLHILHLDTGAMYRTVALYMLRNGIDPQDEQAVSACCGKADVRVAYRDGAQRTMLGEEDVTDLIRTGEVSAAASGISKWPAVRRRMVAAQREIAATADHADRRTGHRHARADECARENLFDGHAGGARTPPLQAAGGEGRHDPL